MEKKLKDKTCKNCGEKFTPWKPLQPVCSPLCEREYKDKKAKEKSEGKPKKKTIAPISEKMKGDLAIYRPIRDKYMKEHPTCECGCGKPSQDLHHKAGRVGYYDEDARLRGLKLLWDKRFFMAVTRKCHRKIEDDPAWAMEQGFKIKRT